MRICVQDMYLSPFVFHWLIIIPHSLLQKRFFSEKDKYHMTPLMCGISTMTQMNLPMKQTQTHRHRDQTCGCQGGKSGWMDWEFGISRLNIGWINNKALLYSTGSYVQYPVINHNEKEYKKECTYIYSWIILLYSRN